MTGAALTAVAEREFRGATRSRWLAAFTVAFLLLGTGMTALGAAGAAFGGAGFGRTAAALVNLMLLIVPLMGLSAGALSLAAERERGTLEPILALPLRPAEIFVGKYLGAAGALAAALALGFGLLGTLLAARGGLGGAGSFATLFGATLLLGWAALAAGFVVSARAGRASVAVGAALTVWLLAVLAGDLGLMGTALATRLPPAALLASAWLNPLSLFRLIAIDAQASGLDWLGPAGHCAQDILGAALRPAAFAGLGLWLLAALGAGWALFRRDPLGGSR